jgi:hypothetical protein
MAFLRPLSELLAGRSPPFGPFVPLCIPSACTPKKSRRYFFCCGPSRKCEKSDSQKITENIYKFSCTTRREVGSRLFTLWPTKRSENASLSIYLRVHTLSWQWKRAPLLTTPRFDVVHSSRHVSSCGLFCSQHRALRTQNLAIKNSNLMDYESNLILLVKKIYFQKNNNHIFKRIYKKLFQNFQNNKI